MEGVLLKWTNYIEFWKERKFVIKGPILSYYVPENKSNKPKRRVFLGLAEIIEPQLELEDPEDDDFGFEVDTGAEHYYMRAKNQEEKQKWLNGLKNGKILGEKLIRDMNKNINQKKDKFDQFKKIYQEKVKNVYKNYKQFQGILKQLDNIINFIEGKEQLKQYKVIVNKNIKINKENSDDNLTINQNEKTSELISNSEIINTDIKNNEKNNNINNNKKLNLNKKYNINKIRYTEKKNINNRDNKLGRLTLIPNKKEKRVIQEKPEGRLTVSINNFTERGYLLKGEEFFDMDESFISKKSQSEINKFNQAQNLKKKQVKINLNVENNKNKNIIKNLNKNTDKIKGAFYDPLYSYQKRTSLPEQMKEVSLNIFKLLKDAIGKDLNHFAMPVTLNEPLSMLQKLCENFQYADLLNKAAKDPNPYMRLAYVACFNIGGFTMNIHRAKKLFNPILFETYEYIDNNLNYRFFSEQVSHHPAISAFFAEGEGWNIYSNNNSKQKISLTGSIEVKNLEKTYLNFTNFSEEINYTKPMCKMRNLLSEPTLELYGKFWVKNNDGDECTVNLIPYNESNKIGNLTGEIKDIEGNIIFKLEGNWCDKIKIINMKNKEEIIIWEIIKSCDKNNHNFQPYTFDLNNLTEEMKKHLPKTDSRFRGDQRLMEYQKFDEAGAEKIRLEEKQRKKRKENEAAGIHPLPRYFEETYDDITGELVYKYKGNYFDDRINNNFKDLPDLFG